MKVEIDKNTVEILPPEGKAKYLKQMISFMHQEIVEIQHRIRCVRSSFAQHRQELTSRFYLLGHKLCLFDSVVTPTMFGSENLDYYAITRKDETDDTTQDAQTHYSNEEEIQDQRSKKDIEGTDVKTNERSGSGEGDSTKVGQDQDSSISFENDTESNASQTDEEEEDWIDYIKRSTREVEEKK